MTANHSSIINRYQSTVEAKKSEVEEQTENILVGQNKLSQQRRTVRDLQSKLLELQESKKAAVTGKYAKKKAIITIDFRTAVQRSLSTL